MESNTLAHNLRRYRLCGRKDVSTHLSGATLPKTSKKSSVGTIDELGRQNINWQDRAKPLKASETKGVPSPETLLGAFVFRKDQKEP